MHGRSRCESSRCPRQGSPTSQSPSQGKRASVRSQRLNPPVLPLRALAGPDRERDPASALGHTGMTSECRHSTLRLPPLELRGRSAWPSPALLDWPFPLDRDIQGGTRQTRQPDRRKPCRQQIYSTPFLSDPPPSNALLIGVPPPSDLRGKAVLRRLRSQPRSYPGRQCVRRAPMPPCTSQLILRISRGN